MRPALRLATSNLSRRFSRTVLLVLVVALSAMLVSAVGTAVGSLRTAVQNRVMGLVGKGDVRIRARGSGNTLPTSVLEKVRATPGVAFAAPRLESTLSLRFGKPEWTKVEGAEDFARSIRVFQVTTRVTGIEPVVDAQLRSITLLSGRLPERDTEIAIDGTLVQRLSEINAAPTLGKLGLSLLAKGTGQSGKVGLGPERVASQQDADLQNARAIPAVGDTLEVVRFGKPAVQITICGIATPPPLGAQPFAYMTLAGVGELAALAGRVSRIDAVLDRSIKSTRDTAALDAFAKQLESTLPTTAMVQTAERVTSGLDKGVRANQMGFVIINLMAVLAAGFIIATGLSTAVAERQRELAVLRCIGAGPVTLAASQLISGGLIGLCGALLGVPPGVGLAFLMLTHYRDKLQADPIIVPESFLIPVAASVLAGLVGALVPAWQASRVSPLRALAARATPPRQRTIRIITICALLGIALHLAIVIFLRNPEVLVAAYLSIAMPGVMIGFFLLGVPAVLLAAKLLAPLLEKLFSLPTGPGI